MGSVLAAPILLSSSFLKYKKKSSVTAHDAFEIITEICAAWPEEKHVLYMYIIYIYICIYISNPEKYIKICMSLCPTDSK